MSILYIKSRSAVCPVHYTELHDKNVTPCERQVMPGEYQQKSIKFKKWMRLYSCPISTDKQEELSPDAQKRLILDYAKKNNIIISSSDIYLEHGISGRKASRRPAFQEMIARAKSKEHPFDVILVWKFSRFARNQEESIVYKSMLKRDSVDVVSISEPMIDGPFGSLIERIIEWMDEYYSIRLSGEVMRGMTEKAMRGGYQSIAPFGYTSAGNGKPPKLNPNQTKIVRLIFSSFLDGKTYNSIARKLNESGIRTINGNPFEARTIKYILENPFYCGKIRWNYTKRGRELKDSDEWIITDGKHEALVSEAEWQAVQERIKSLDLPFKRRDVATCKHWLSGILKCSSCGASLGFNNNPRSPFFQCWKYSKGICPESHSVIARKIEENVIAGLRESILTGNLQYKIVKSVSKDDFNEPEALKEQLNRIKMKEIRIRDAYENGIDTLEEYQLNKSRIQDEKATIENKISELTSSSSASKGFEPEKHLIHNVQSAIDILTHPETDYEEKGAAIRSVIDKIVYDKKTEHLDFFFFLSEP